MFASLPIIFVDTNTKRTNTHNGTPKSSEGFHSSQAVRPNPKEHAATSPAAREPDQIAPGAPEETLTFERYYQHSVLPCGFTINSRGLILFRAAMCKQFDLHAMKSIALWFDPVTGRIGLQPCRERADGNAVISRTKTGSLVTSMKGFAKRHNIAPGRFTATWNEDHTMIVCTREPNT